MHEWINEMTKYTRENLLPASLLITALSLPFSPILLAVPGLVPPSPFCLSSPSYHSSALPPYFQPPTQACLDLQHSWQGHWQPSSPACSRAYYVPGIILSTCYTLSLFHRMTHLWTKPAIIHLPSDRASSLRPREGVFPCPSHTECWTCPLSYLSLAFHSPSRETSQHPPHSTRCKPPGLTSQDTSHWGHLGDGLQKNKGLDFSCQW